MKPARRSGRACYHLGCARVLPTPPHAVEASYQLAFLLASRATPSTPDTSNDSRDPQVTLWMTVRKRKWEPARTAPIFYGSGHMPFHVGPVQPVKKVALSSNNVRLRHAEEQSMRTSRPPGMGRRCAPRRQYRPPSGDPHPGDGAMASRPSRCSKTCPWRLSGSSGPRPRIWALGGLVRPVQKYKSLENALMPRRPVTHGRSRTRESAGRP